MKSIEEIIDNLFLGTPVYAENVLPLIINNADLEKSHPQCKVSGGLENTLFFRKFFLPLLDVKNEEAREEGFRKYFNGLFNRFSDVEVGSFFANQDFSFAEKVMDSTFKGLFKNEFIDYVNYLSAPNFVNDFNSRVFMGKKGHTSYLHFDWKAQSNILIQLSGRKKVTLYSPLDSHKLGYAGNLSRQGIFGVETNLTPVFEKILNPGDAIVIPPFYWHELSVLEDSVSVSFRAFSNPVLGFFVQNTPSNWEYLPLFEKYLKNQMTSTQLIKNIKDIVISQGQINHQEDNDIISNKIWDREYRKYIMSSSRDKDVKINWEPPYNKIVRFPSSLQSFLF